MDSSTVRMILSDVSYEDACGQTWEWDVMGNEDGGAMMRARFSDLRKLDATPQTGRWWRISKHATKSEVVHTALLAVLTAEEHETRERFLYKGRRIFGPHFDVDKLVDFARFKGNLDCRKEMVHGKRKWVRPELPAGDVEGDAEEEVQGEPLF